jgi:phage shock protein C
MSYYDSGRDANGLGRLKRRRREGWGEGLYRNTRAGRIGGVAAGVADYFDVAHWVIRLCWVGLFLFTGTLALWAYLAGWILLAPRPRVAEAGAYVAGGAPRAGGGRSAEYDERLHAYRARSPFRYSEPPAERLRRAQQRLDAAVRRVEDMESYVTSRQYQLDREFAELGR